VTSDRTPASIIRSKRDGEELSASALRSFVQGFLNGDVADYQMSAFLMAITLRGMSARETTDLTRAMAESGERLDFSAVSKRKVDKHSTGGVGDVISLPLVPLVAAGGAAVPMIAGRGLGHTGGTLDKLDAIPGFHTDLDRAQFERTVERAGAAISGQTRKLAPADRRMYALRDVTATVESLPLIVSSILSKKLAAGLDALVLDVKCGGGAFMQEERFALELAERLVSTADALGLPTVAFVTGMEAPLGRAVGNAVEVASAVQCLHGEGPPDVMELVLTLGTAMLSLAEPDRSWSEHWTQLERNVADGSGRKCFKAMIREQGGDERIVDDPTRLPQAPCRFEVTAPRDGFVTAIDARGMGQALLYLGGGRRKADDAVDPAVGVRIHRRPGEKVSRGETLATVLARTAGEAERVGTERVLPCFAVGAESPTLPPLIRFLVTRDRVKPWQGAETWSDLDLPNLLRIP
jgi:pyrimidine-nucleoside phosphorylase